MGRVPRTAGPLPARGHQISPSPRAHGHRLPAPTRGGPPAPGGTPLDAAADLFLRAVPLHQAGNLDAAEQLYQQALALRPDWADGLNTLGLALDSGGDFDGGLACYRRAVELKPDGPEALNNLGMALLEQGDAAGAVALLRRSLAAQPAQRYVHHNLL